MNKNFYTSSPQSLEGSYFSDEEVTQAILNKYTFNCAYHPEGYDVVFLCITDDKEDSRKDEWKAVFFKKKKKRTGTVTLDNINELEDEAETEIVFFKEVEGNYEDMINVSVDLIKKHITKVKKQDA